MSEHYVNLHTGNLWMLSADMGTVQEYQRLKDGITITGVQPQYFRKIKSVANKDG